MTRPKRIFDEETIRRIRAALESGANLQDLAGRFQVSKMYFVRAGLTRRKINPPPCGKRNAPHAITARTGDTGESMRDDTMELQKVCHVLVFRVAHCCFSGQLPADSTRVVGSILQILPADTSAETKEEIIPHLVCAIEGYQKMQQSSYPQ